MTFLSLVKSDSAHLRDTFSEATPRQAGDEPADRSLAAALALVAFCAAVAFNLPV